VDLFKKKTQSCGIKHPLTRMTNSIRPLISGIRPAILLLIFWITACQGRGSKEQDVAGTDVPLEPITAQPNMPETSDVDEKNVLYPGQSLWAGGYGLVLDAGTLQLTVVDSGPGIHTNDLSHLFDRYFQTTRPTNQQRAARASASPCVRSMCSCLAEKSR
jgi:hypothetical protein